MKRISAGVKKLPAMLLACVFLMTGCSVEYSTASDNSSGGLVTVTGTETTAESTTSIALTTSSVTGTSASATESAASLLSSDTQTQSAATSSATQAVPATTAAPVTQETDPPAPTPASGSREIYLTFDDGPCENTLTVLDILDEHGAKATFFTVGFYVDRYPYYAAETVKRGNLLACHSYTHEMDQCYASVQAFMDELDQWKTAATKACGSLPERLCVRFPGGSTTHYADAVRSGIKQSLGDAGCRWFDWDGGENDKWPAGNTKNLPEEEYYMESYRDCMNWFKDDPEKPVVFLFHDTEIGTVHVLPDILEDLKARGYTFKTLDEHPKWDAAPET